MAKSIAAEVAMKIFFSKLKAAIVIPLIAPPVPNKPAVKPESELPIKVLLEVGFTTNSFLIKNNKLNAIKKTAKTI